MTPGSRGRGRFITLEGIEGVGKSTQLTRIVDALEARGLDVLVTREPGGTPTAEQIRSLVLDHGDEPMPANAEVLLVFAARALHVENLIRPALEAGRWVVSDRFVDASRAYQGGGRGIDSAKIEMLAELALGGLVPDATVLLDAPVDVGLARADRRGGRDRIESETRPFFERVRSRYLELAGNEPERFVTVNADDSAEAVGAAVDRAIADILICFKI